MEFATSSGHVRRSMWKKIFWMSKFVYIMYNIYLTFMEVALFLHIKFYVQETPLILKKRRRGEGWVK
jgi:hypothetical protein